MRTIQPQAVIPQPKQVRVDWSKPVVVFDPWPFADRCVPITDGPHFWLDPTSLELTLRNGDPLSQGKVKSAIFQREAGESVSTLGWTTVGLVVVGREGAFKRLYEKDHADVSN